MSRALSMRTVERHIANGTLKDLCGQYLGGGIARKVYRCSVDDHLVIKIEKRKPFQDFQNVTEWNVWRGCPPKWEKWLAPCEGISNDATVLLQCYAAPLEDMVIKKIPVWLDDLSGRPDNMGVYNNHPVAVDYGRHHLIEFAFKAIAELKSARQMKKVHIYGRELD